MGARFRSDTAWCTMMLAGAHLSGWGRGSLQVAALLQGHFIWALYISVQFLVLFTLHIGEVEARGCYIGEVQAHGVSRSPVDSVLNQNEGCQVAV